MPSSPFNLNLNRLTRDQFLSMVNLATSTLAPEAVPPAPAPPPPIAGIGDEVATLKVSAGTFADDKAAWEAAKAAVVTAKAKMDASQDVAKDDLRALASVIEGKAKGNVAILSLSTLPLAGAPVPKQIPAQISNLSVTVSDMEGGLDVQFDPEENSDIYETEITTVDPIAGPWIRSPRAIPRAFPFPA